MSMTPYEQYKKNCLSQPISIKPSLKTHALVWGGAPALLVGSFIASVGDDLKTQIIGGIGVIFFGCAFVLLASALLRSRSKGLVEFSDDGLWLATLGATLPWCAIGPAWINTTKHAGRKTEDVVFIAKEIDLHTADINFLSRLQLKRMKRTLDVGKGGYLDFGLKPLFNIADDENAFEDLVKQIEYARAQAQSDPTAVLLNIPVPFRIGIPPHELVAILNSELSKRLANDSPIQ